MISQALTIVGGIVVTLIVISYLLLKKMINLKEILEQIIREKLCKRGEKYIAKRKREGEKHNPFLAARAVKVCKGQIKGADGKQKKDF